MAWRSSASAGGLQNTVTGMIYPCSKVGTRPFGFHRVSTQWYLSKLHQIDFFSPDQHSYIKMYGWALVVLFHFITCDVQVHFAIGWCSNRTDFDFRYHRTSTILQSCKYFLRVARSIPPGCGMNTSFIFFRQVISNEAHDPERFMQACPWYL